MATYKLIQDIEAEDHILGPLTLRQFVFLLITGFLLYLDFITVIKRAPFLLIILGPPTVFCGFFAAPLHGDQPTDVWALARLRFLFKPRKRLWNQSGLKEMVTITVPKKVERVYTDGLTQMEVRSRLKALANTIDTHGWAVKNMGVGYTPTPVVSADSDRLIHVSDVPQAVPDDDFSDTTDMLDVDSSPVAEQLDDMMNRSMESHRSDLYDQLDKQIVAQQLAAQSATNQTWFTQPSPTAAVAGAAVPASAEPTAEEQALIARAKAQQAATHTQANNNLRTLQPLGATPTPVAAAPTAGLRPTDPAILSLANNNDLNVSTLAREAKKQKGEDNEVVISLH